MKLKAVYDSFEDIPEGYGDLYTERNGKFEFTGVEGIKTQSDIERLQNALVKERNDHKKAKETLQAFGDLDPAAIHEKLENYDSLSEQVEALKSANGKMTDEQLEPLLNARVKQAVGPLEREKQSLTRKIDEINRQIAEKDNQLGSLQQGITRDKIERALRDAAGEMKVISSAIMDAVIRGRDLFEFDEAGRLITKDGSDATAGLSPKEWLKEMQEKTPHWWPASVGGGANGGGPNGFGGGAGNPWSREHWNVTKQGAYVKQFGIDKASQMAERVGSKVGATKPSAAA